MPDWEVVVVYGIIFSIVGVITYFTIQSQKAEILKVLEKRGEKDIIISWSPFDFDKSNNTYIVEYEDLSGKKHNTTCKIHFWGSSIYWEDDDK